MSSCDWEGLDREINVARATIVVVIQTPSNGSLENQDASEGGSENQELGYYGERNDKTSDVTESVYKFMGSFIEIFTFIHLFIIY